MQCHHSPPWDHLNCAWGECYQSTWPEIQARQCQDSVPKCQRFWRQTERSTNSCPLCSHYLAIIHWWCLVECHHSLSYPLHQDALTLDLDRYSLPLIARQAAQVTILLLLRQGHHVQRAGRWGIQDWEWGAWSNRPDLPSTSSHKGFSRQARSPKPPRSSQSLRRRYSASLGLQRFLEWIDPLVVIRTNYLID